MTRRYASFFEWPDRQRAELGVVEEWIATLSARGERHFRDPRSLEPDPPDCVCLNEAGAQVAVEVTEIVCSTAAQLNARGQQVYRNWQPGELRDHIAAQLAQKDGKVFHGGPYAEIIVCMFTDEPVLDIGRLASELADETFGPFHQITSAYILTSYSPESQDYPALRLRLFGSKD